MPAYPTPENQAIGCDEISCLVFQKMAFHAERPNPGTGWNARLWSFSLLLVFLSMVSSAVAYDIEFDSRAYDSRQYRKMERLGQIHVDPRPPPTVPGRMERRQVGSASTSSAQSVLTATITPSSAESSSPSSTSATSPGSSQTPSATVVITPLPSPFDTSLGSNFTAQSCPDFFNTFLSNATFKSCTAISLLLQNSNSFFQAERDSTLLSETLDIACNAPLAICSPLMESLSQQLISTTNCGADYAQQNPLVMQAYHGLIAYEPLYRATCLKDPETGSYCFSEAIMNSSAPADSYPYYTALGLPMPVGARPTCNKCLQETMNVFVGYAPDENQPLASTYTATSYQVDLGCGSTFVNTTVAASTTGSASSLRAGSFGLVALALVTVVFIA